MFGSGLRVVGVLVGALYFMHGGGQVRAELMLDRVPNDALIYVGWRGTEALGETFDDSHFGVVRRSTNVDQLLTSVLPIAGAFMDEPGGQVARLATQLDRVLWERPWAIFVGDPASLREGSGPPPVSVPTLRLGLLVDAGPHASQVRRALQPWEQAFTDDATPATWVEEDGIVGLLVGYDAQQVRDIRVMWQSLSRDNAFTEARRQVMRDPALLAYVDTQRLSRRLVETAARSGLFDATQVEAVLAELGLDGLKRAIYAGGFDRRMWQGQMFVEAPAPRRGVVKLFDAEAITDRDLRLVPRSAAWLSAYRLDPAVALAALERAVPSLAGAAGPLDPPVQQALAAGLGDLWLFYSDPGFATAAGPGVVLVHRLRDVEPVEAALASLADRLNAAQPDAPAVEQVVVDGATIHQVAAVDEAMALAWTVADGRLYLGTGAPTVAAARAHAARPGNGVTESSRFQRLRERLGNPPAGTRLTFADLQSTAPAMFQGYAHAMQLETIPFAPRLNLPDLRHLMPYLVAAGKAGWTDDRGWHARSIGPFPGASLLSPCATVNLGTGTFAATLLFSTRTTTVAEQ